jgi:hypothetical protein
MFIEWFPTNLALLIKGTQELQKFQRLSILYMGFNYLLFICFFLKGVGQNRGELPLLAIFQLYYDDQFYWRSRIHISKKGYECKWT